MTSFWGQVRWAKMIPSGSQVTELACYLTKKVNKAEGLTYLSTNIDLSYPEL